VSLYDPAHPTNLWVLNGLGYTFPPNTTMAANSRLVLVSDNPTAFRARHNVAAQVPILQYLGGLQDSGENLELTAPAVPATNGVPYYVVDAVRYNDRSPWPLAADGAGASLQRGHLFPRGGEESFFGNDPASWYAALPTPGFVAPVVVPPLIDAQPLSRTNVAYTDVTFTVLATGDAPLHYQWRFGNDNIDGATNATLLITNVQPSQAGNYSVVIFNQSRSAESSDATLTILTPPSILQQPTTILARIRPDPSAAATTNVTFCVTANTFNPPLTYQWRFNGADIPGATASCFTVTNVQLTSEGEYSVIVSDRIGPVTSQTANLFPLIGPVLVQPPLAQSVPVGAPVTLSASVTGHPEPFTFEWRRNTTVLATNVVSARDNFFTFNAASTVSTQQYRVIIKNMANPQPGIASQFVNIITLADTDSDGIPDEWENDHGFNPGSNNDRDTDADTDGLTNLEEYLAGTNPTNNSSFLRLDITRGTLPTLNVGAISNRTYAIDYRDNLNQSWSRLADILAHATNRVETIIEPAWTTNRFYRAVTPRPQ
jgi:hypothetical protein